jgi:hypothetical protein
MTPPECHIVTTELPDTEVIPVAATVRAKPTPARSRCPGPCICCPVPLSVEADLRVQAIVMADGPASQFVYVIRLPGTMTVIHQTAPRRSPGNALLDLEEWLRKSNAVRLQRVPLRRASQVLADELPSMPHTHRAIIAETLRDAGSYLANLAYEDQGTGRERMLALKCREAVALLEGVS